jgi:anti-anti-sigma factor
VTSIVTRRATPSVAVVALLGGHDLHDCESLETALARAGILARNVIVDLTRCTFIDSTLVGALLRAQSVTACDGGRFALALPANPNAVTRTAELMNLDFVFALYPSLEAAFTGMPPVLAAVIPADGGMPAPPGDVRP